MSLTSPQTSLVRVQEFLEQLKLEAALGHLQPVLERAQQEQRLPVQVLDELLEYEVSARFERRIRANFRFSGLPRIQRLEDFDFAAQPQLPQRTIEELATLRFLANGENALFLGPPGVGKTHLAIGLAVKALEHGHGVYFLSLHDLVNRSRTARRTDRLMGLMRTLNRADLLVLDELGFVPLEPEDATFLFELVNKRYQAARSLIVTSNKSFGQWGELFPDQTLAIALLDRLLHHATTVNIRGDSYRLRHRREAGVE